jgi:hypothetical protein
MPDKRASRGWRRELRQIGVVAALTLAPSLIALHFLYAGLDTRYRHLWGMDRASEIATAPQRKAAGETTASNDVKAMAGQLIMVGFRGT